MKDKKQKDLGALFIPAGTLIGIGVGMLKGHVAAGTLIGVGAGFLVFAIISVMKKK